MVNARIACARISSGEAFIMNGRAYSLEEADLFLLPSRIIIAGYSNSGKTTLCQDIIVAHHAKFSSIIYCGVTEHPLQSHTEIARKLTISKGIVNPFEYTDGVVGDKGLLLILDDLFMEASDNKFVTEAFTAGRHSKISVILITQNVFHSGKFSRSISLNCSQYVLMKNRDVGQIEVLGRQLFGKRKGSDFAEIYKRALSYNRYGYLLVDLGANTPEELQLRTNIVGETEYQVVFQW